MIYRFEQSQFEAECSSIWLADDGTYMIGAKRIEHYPTTDAQKSQIEID